MKNAYIAADTSNASGLLILFNEQKILYEGKIENKLEHATKIGLLFKEALDVIQEKKLILEGVLAGIGPGSFVGIRIALATLLGFSLAKNRPLFGFCSHKALFYSVDSNQALVYILMKACGDLFYLSVFSNGEEVKEKSMTNMRDFLRDADKNSCLLTDDKENQELLLDFKEVFFLNACTPQGLWLSAKEKIESNKNMVDEGLSLKAQYVALPNVKPNYKVPQEESFRLEE